MQLASWKQPSTQICVRFLVEMQHAGSTVHLLVVECFRHSCSSHQSHRLLPTFIFASVRSSRKPLITDLHTPTCQQDAVQQGGVHTPWFMVTAVRLP